MTQASSLILDHLQDSDIAFTGHLFTQFLVLYLWLQAYDATLLTVTCSDTQSLRDVLWISSVVLNGDIVYVDLDKTREQDPRLESVAKKLKKIITARSTNAATGEKLQPKKKLTICFEEIKTCPKVYPALKEMLSGLKDGNTQFILIRDQLTEQRKISKNTSSEEEKQYFNDDSIFFDNYNEKDTEIQMTKYILHQVRKLISSTYEEFHGDLSFIISRVNISKTVPQHLIKTLTLSLLKLLNQLMERPLLLPGAEIASYAKNQG